MANNEAVTDKAPEMAKLEREGKGRNPREYRRGVTSVGSCEDEVHCSNSKLLEKVVDRSNLWKALRKVKANQGGAGVDGMTVD